MKDTKDQEPVDTQTPHSEGETHESQLLLVGIGASAGGLEALRALVSNLPHESRMSYVIAQHLSPTHPSMLVQLLSRETTLSVVEIRDSVEPAPNIIYITPINKNIRIEDGKLRLSDPFKHALPKPSVDYLFKSMADEYGENAIGIILSGTGSDGAHGVRAIKGAGGFLFAQDEASARYNGMPRAAVETGCVDMVLSPEKIASELGSIAQLSSRGAPFPGKSEHLLPVFERILGLVRARTRVDFLNYKDSTIQRRMRRRMVACHVETMEEYEQFLNSHPDEIERLAQNLIISVTSFFRDRDAFRSLDDTLGQIIKSKRPQEEIRIWVPGCATGEEAYSMAILLAERLTGDLNQFKIQIFATDIDGPALSRARKGVFHVSSMVDMDPRLISRYFSLSGDTYQIVKSLRDLLVFARQDLVSDPPFLHLDLISCRNVLIYFNSTLQAKVLEIFHYGLKSRGFLFLGRSESITQREELFESVHVRWKLFRRREVATRYRLQFQGNTVASTPDKTERTRARTRQGLLERMQSVAMANYLPPGVLVDKGLQLRQVMGDVSRYLHIPSGEPNFAISSLARRELRVTLHGLLIKCQRQRQVVRSHPIHLEDIQGLIRVAVHPVPADEGSEDCYLVCFESVQDTLSGVASNAPSGNIEPRVMELEEELTATREHLQTVIEELETSNEELQSLNEELQSSNEELHSTNEELETSNEELQSTNEELTTVNEELQVKTSELAESNSALENIKDCLIQALVLLDEQLRVTLFNPVAARVLGLTVQDIGQTLTGLPLRLNIPNLRNYLLDAVRDSRSITVSVPGERSYLMAVQPYYALHRMVKGVIVTLFDNTDIKRIEQLQRDGEQRIITLLHNSPLMTVVLDPQSTIMFANPEFKKYFNLGDTEVVGHVLPALLTPERAAALTTLAGHVLTSLQTRIEEIRLFSQQGETIFLCNAFAILNQDGSLYGICIKGQDITNLKTVEKRLKESERFSRAIIDALSEQICVLDETGQIIAYNSAWEQFATENAPTVDAHLLSGNYLDVCERANPETDPEANLFAQGIRQVLSGEFQEFSLEYPCHAPELKRWFIGKVTRFQGDGPVRLVVAHENITQRKEAELRIQDNERLLNTIVNSTPDIIFQKNREHQLMMVNQSMANLLGFPIEKILGHTDRELGIPDGLVLGDTERGHRGYWNDDDQVFHTGETVIIPNDPVISRGELRIFHTIKTPIRSQQGEIIGLLAYGRDITERTEAEELVKDRAIRLRAIFDMVPDGIIITDERGQIEGANPAAEVTFGYTAHELMGMSLMQLISVSNQELDSGTELLPSQPSKEFTRQLTVSREVIGRRRSGVRFPVEMAISQTELPTGKRLNTAILRDITRRKETEGELRRARDLAEQANRAKSNFLSQMSHELRTPLNAILGFAQLMEADRGQPLLPRQRENTQQILKAGWHLLELINEILDLAKIEAGHIDLTIEPVSLSDLVSICEEMIIPMAGNRGIRVENLLPKASLTVLADRTRLRQMLINLLSNAVKYNRHDGQIFIELLSAEPERIRIGIRDSGVGISSEDMKRLFQPFVRLGTKSHQEDGTGIGLVITKRLAELMGGRVGASSELGVGSTFWIDLAMAQTSDGNRADKTDLPLLDTPPSLQRTPHVLYIEDNHANFDLLRHLLELYTGIALLRATTGTEGLALAHAHKPDLIMLDIGLPDMNGFEVLKKIQEDPDLAAIPVFALSANALPAEVQRGLQAGFTQYFTKPIDLQLLLRELKSLLKLEDERSSIPT